MSPWPLEASERLPDDALSIPREPPSVPGEVSPLSEEEGASPPLELEQPQRPPSKM